MRTMVSRSNVSRSSVSRTKVARTSISLPRWRGFNINPTCEYNTYTQAHFQQMALYGFNFVRIMAVYGYFVCDLDGSGTYGVISSLFLSQLDNYISWATSNGIHVCLCVAMIENIVNEFGDDPGAMTITQIGYLTTFWATMAARYKGVYTPAQLSFDLMNEPSSTTDAPYIQVISQAIAAVRNIDPSRLIVCDGNSVAVLPVAGLTPLNVVQSTHCYEPGCVTAYQESSNPYPLPTWPCINCSNIMIAGNGALTINGTFKAGDVLKFHVVEIYSNIEITITATGTATYDVASHLICHDDSHCQCRWK